MKLGDNGEAFFVEETEEEYVSLRSLQPLTRGAQASGTWPNSGFFLFCFFETEFRSLLPRLECNGVISAHHNLCLSGSSNSPATVSQVSGIIDARHHVQLAFCI